MASCGRFAGLVSLTACFQFGFAKRKKDEVTCGFESISVTCRLSLLSLLSYCRLSLLSLLHLRPLGLGSHSGEGKKTDEAKGRLLATQGTKQKTLREVLTDFRRGGPLKKFTEDLKPFFTRYDSDGLGKISSRDFEAVLKELDVPRGMRTRIFREVDADSDNNINFIEFVQCMKDHARELSHKLHSHRND